MHTNTHKQTHKHIINILHKTTPLRPSMPNRKSEPILHYQVYSPSLQKREDRAHQRHLHFLIVAEVQIYLFEVKEYYPTTHTSSSLSQNNTAQHNTAHMANRL